MISVSYNLHGARDILVQHSKDKTGEPLGLTRSKSNCSEAMIIIEKHGHLKQNLIR